MQRARLEERYAASRVAEAAGDLPAALRELNACMELLPEGSRQARQIQEELRRVAHLYNSRKPALDDSRMQAPQAEALTRVSPPRAVLVALGWSLQGLARPWTLISLVVWVASFALLMGWRMALLFGLLIYAHEIGHLIAIRIYGFRFSWPIFVPFIGAFVLQGRASTSRREQCVIALAGPLAGFVVGGVLALILLTPARAWLDAFLQSPGALERLCFLNLLLNFFNLLPVWQLDGGRIARALRGRELLWLAGLLLVQAVGRLNWYAFLMAVAWLMQWLIGRDEAAKRHTPAAEERLRAWLAVLVAMLIGGAECLRLLGR